MALLSELELPVLDYADPALRGPAFHPRMAELRAQGWLAATPIGAMVLDREAAEIFLRSRSTTFPGLNLAELFSIETGPLPRSCGAASSASTATTTGACATSSTRPSPAGRRPLAAGHADYLEQLWTPSRRRALRVRRGLRQALPVAGHRDPWARP
jgi:hypothetical protein